ncbi:facilitated trehalose transporter Tret1-like [Xylocopa sonorina]|uniref:facilitated trehalose transporter Tret1-like n=1 Tax=Xylocopa sonorina TaxID=1818115 RepID=UPI00403B24DE
MSNIKVYFVTFVVCLAQFTGGIFLGWTSPMALKLLDHDLSLALTTDEVSWTVSSLILGMAFGCFVSMFTVDLIGRKISILVTIVPIFLCWLLIIWNPSIGIFYTARFIAGGSSGIIFISGSLYLAEISFPRVRGAVCCCLALMNYCTNLLGYVVGSFGTTNQYSYTAMSLGMLQFVTLVWFPETPYYLLRRKRLDGAMDSLIFWRGSSDVAEEMDLIMKSVGCDPRSNGILSSVHHLVTRSEGKIAITSGICVMILQAFSSSFILIDHIQIIFERTEDVKLQGVHMSIVITIIHLISYLVCISLVDRLGRKPLLIISTLGVAGCTLFLGVYFCMRDNNMDVKNLQVLLFTVMLLYAVSVSLGLASVPFVIVHEIFPLHARTTCIGFCFSINFVCSFVVSRVWNIITFQRDTYLAFWFLSGLHACSVPFLVFCLSETKGKTFLQIENDFVVKMAK